MKPTINLIVILFFTFNLSAQLFEITRVSDNSITVCGSNIPATTDEDDNLVGIPMSQIFMDLPSDIANLTYLLDPNSPLTINGESIQNIEGSITTQLLVFSTQNNISTPLIAEGCVNISWNDGAVSSVGSMYDVYHMNTTNLISSGMILENTVENIPTLSEWGIVILSIAFSIVGVLFMEQTSIDPIKVS